MGRVHGRWFGIGGLATAAAVVGAVVASGATSEHPLPGSPNACLKGTASSRWCGDHGRASRAKVSGPTDVSAIGTSGYLIADAGNHVIRWVHRGRIDTVAGIGLEGRDGDGGRAVDARLSTPMGVAALKQGAFLVADSGNGVVRRVDRRGVIKTVAGVEGKADLGDRGPAKRADLEAPADVVVLRTGGYLIADPVARRVRKVDSAGVITTVAGNGMVGNTGDGGPATDAPLGWPIAVAAEPDGGFLIADATFDTVRRVDPQGVITTVAGGGNPRTPATRARLFAAQGVAATGDGGFLVSDSNRLHRVSADGAITPVAGTGSSEPVMESGAATDMALRGPAGIAWLGADRALIAERGYDRIRRLSGGRLATKVGLDVPDDSAPPEPLPAPPPPGNQPLANTDGKPGRCSGPRTNLSIDLAVWRFQPRRVSRRPGILVGATNRGFRAKFTVEVRLARRPLAKGSATRVGAEFFTLRLNRRLAHGKYRVNLTATYTRHGRRTTCTTRVVRLLRP